jgi:hypothetical protein
MLDESREYAGCWGGYIWESRGRRSKRHGASAGGESDQWLTTQGIATQRFSAARGGTREVILVGSAPPAGDRAKAFEELNARISQGATAIFLSPSVFAEDIAPVAWLPASAMGTLGSMNSWLYLMDAWGKAHPLFNGLPTKGLLGYVFYQNLIRDLAFNIDSAPIRGFRRFDVGNAEQAFLLI